jgi:ubiquitin-conjugating enzyme E2 J1
LLVVAKADIRELALDPSDQYYAAPLENDMFEWHFTIRGAEGTDFEGGIYHGRILLPAEYPYKPPHIVFLTPSGRFETNTKVCLSFSAFHPELWQPAWGIRLILEALISFLPTPGDGAIGALDYKPEERRRLAKQSQSFSCPTCGPVAKLLRKLDPDGKKSAKSGGGSSGAFGKEIAKLQKLQLEREGGKKRNKNTTNSDKTEEKIAATTAPAVGEQAERKTEAKTMEDTKFTEEVPELLSSDADNDNKVPASTIKEITNEAAVLLTVSNAAATTAAAADDNSNGASADVDAAAAISEEEPRNSVVAANNTAEGDAHNDVNNLSYLYDASLNISIFLMFCICVLLCKKFMDLSRELNELRETPIVDTFIEKAASAASSVAASAAASEEL